MKKCLMFVPLALLALLTSCDNTALTAGEAEDAVKMDASWDNRAVQKRQFRNLSDAYTSSLMLFNTFYDRTQR